MIVRIHPLFFSFVFFVSPAKSQQVYDIIIKNGIIYDGSGTNPFEADVAIAADTIAAIGDLSGARSKKIIDAKNLAVTPGFINMLSWANVSLIADGRSQSDIRQGVTLEVMGEGSSMGPLNEKMKNQLEVRYNEYGLKANWNTLGEYLQFLESKGISCNVASFVGATTVREYIIGEESRDPDQAELDSMKLLVKLAMEEGALGVGSSLIYPPAFFAKTNELTELCKTAGQYGGIYISHMRSEGNLLIQAVEELISIAKEANVRAEIYHLKAAGKSNWGKLDSLIAMINTARKEGVDVAANMYVYEAGATGLTASFPPSLQDGGFGKLWERLHSKKWRKEMKNAMRKNASDWENLYYAAGSADRVLLLGFRQDSLKKFTGKTLREVADLRGTGIEETAMDLIIQDSSRVGTAYFMMNEDNIKKEIALPWITFGSDAGSIANEGIFLQSNTHPRAYGNVARLLGKYVRDENVINLPEAIYKLSKLPAEKLNIKKRGELKVGYFADVVVFDPVTIADHATFEYPHQYATGVKEVFVNGVQVLANGEHTGATPGRFIKGPGYKNE
jgi:N-acyl-D-amino-acid deacylase